MVPAILHLLSLSESPKQEGGWGGTQVIKALNMHVLVCICSNARRFFSQTLHQPDGPQMDVPMVSLRLFGTLISPWFEGFGGGGGGGHEAICRQMVHPADFLKTHRSMTRTRTPPFALDNPTAPTPECEGRNRIHIASNLCAVWPRPICNSAAGRDFLVCSRWTRCSERDDIRVRWLRSIENYA